MEPRDYTEGLKIFAALTDEERGEMNEHMRRVIETRTKAAC